MSRETSERHLDAELMQAFLDGAAPPEDAARVRAHASACPRCRSELEAWQTLFGALGELDDVPPATDFTQRVLQALPPAALVAPPWRTRALAWIRGRGAGTGRAAPLLAHVSAEQVQDFLEGVLPRPEATRVEGHLHACHACRTQIEAWRSLMTEVTALPHLSPSAGFAERVMAHVRVQLAADAARATWGERLRLLASGVSPSTRKRAAAIAGAAVTPAALLGLLAYTVFSHPLVTPRTIASFLWLHASGALTATGAGLMGRLSEVSFLTRTWELAQQAVASPVLALLAALGGAALIATAAWVLYRNVFAAPAVDGSYAR